MAGTLPLDERLAQLNKTIGQLVKLQDRLQAQQNDLKAEIKAIGDALYELHNKKRVLESGELEHHDYVVVNGHRQYV